VFFEEMWPVLCDAMERLTAFIASDAHTPGDELPGKTFFATPGFEQHQTGDGVLTHGFALGEAVGRRMVVPYQMWMLGRLERVLAAATATERGRSDVAGLLAGFDAGPELQALGQRLAGCRVRKQAARLHSVV
jgi:hypothetical protein